MVPVFSVSNISKYPFIEMIYSYERPGTMKGLASNLTFYDDLLIQNLLIIKISTQKK